MIRAIGIFCLLVFVTLSIFIAYDWAFWYNQASMRLGSRPNFEDAMERYPTKEVILGDLRATLSSQKVDDATLSQAIDYATELESSSLLIWAKGQLVVERYWNGYDASLRPESASMHKSLLAIVVGQAIEDGYIQSLTDPVKLYVPEWEGTRKGEITLKDVMTMSSGFKPTPPTKTPFSNYWRLAHSMRMENLVLSFEPEFPAGTEFYYSNENSQLLGVILERAIGMRYADYVSKRLWKPLGADDAYVWLDRPRGMPRTYAAFLARPKDWMRLGLLIKNDGRVGDTQVVRKEWLEKMKTPSAKNPNYGLQIWLSSLDTRKRHYNGKQEGIGFSISKPFVSNDLVYFDGFGGQRVYISQDDDYVIVRTGKVRIDWDEAVLPNLVASYAQIP